MVSTGTGFAAIVGSVLITFSLSSLIGKSFLFRYSCWGNKMTCVFRKLSPWLKMDFKIPQFSVWAWGDCQIWKWFANIWYWDSFPFWYMKSVCKRVWLATLGDCFFFLPMRRLYLVCLQKFIAFLDLFRSLLDARTKHSSDTGTWTLNSYLPSYRECKVKGINSWGNKGRQNNFLNWIKAVRE